MAQRSGSDSVSPSDAQQSPRSQPEDLWHHAFNRLTTEDLQQLASLKQQNLNKQEKRNILVYLLEKAEQKKQEWKANRWNYERNEKKVIILDVWAKITNWITSVIAIVDVAVQYDQAHAALPWAGIRLVLQVAVNDNQTQGAIAEGLEVLSVILMRYEMVEQIYLRKASKAKDLLVNAITKLYVLILEYLAKAIKYYSQSTAKRLVKSVTDGGTKVRQCLSKISAAEMDVDSLRRDIDLEFQEMAYDKLNALPVGLKLLWESLEKPIVRIANQIALINDREISAMEAEKRRKILSWLSTVSYRDHYEDIRDGILANTGQWLLNKPEFLNWRRSSVSSILWLRGIPGSGKSMASTIVLENMLDERSRQPLAAPVAFFYCARNPAEPERSDPSEILRAILRQLCSSAKNEPIREPILNEYERRKENSAGDFPRTLDEKDCLKLILMLTADNPATIVIDALDECDPKRRYKLLNGLRIIVQQSVNLVKIFVSSRDNRDIISQLDDVPTIFINASENSEDIQRFVESEVGRAINERRLLYGKVEAELRARIIGVLTAGAQGMFRWASLSIQSLCDSEHIKLAGDVELALGRLPKDLSGLYDIIYTQLPSPPGHDKSVASKTLNSALVAKRTLSWILCAQAHLSGEQFIAAVSGDFCGQPGFVPLTTDEILDVCCNLVVQDTKADTFRFAHLSVREYLENRPEYSKFEQHALAIDRCLHSFIRFKSSASIASAQEDQFKTYAMYQLGVHYNQLENCARDESESEKTRLKMREFFFRDGSVGPVFKDWNCIVLDELSSKKSYQESLARPVCSPPSPLIFACAFGLLSVVEDLDFMTNVSWNQENRNGESALQIAAHGGNAAICEILLKHGVDVNPLRDEEASALLIAARHGNVNVVEVLLAHGAEIRRKFEHRKTALFEAIAGGHKEVVIMLLKVGGHRYTEHSYRSELFLAASKGRRELVEMLLEYGADVNSSCALQEAAYNGSEEIVDILLKSGAAVNNRGFTGELALERAAAKGHLEILKTLIDYGANVNAKAKYDGTALGTAALEGHYKIIEVLLKHGAEVNAKSGYYGYALQAAAFSGYQELVRILLRHGADTNAEGGHFGFALQAAAYSGHQKIVECLLENGADITAKGGACGSALQAAITEGHHKVVETLLKHGNGVNTRNKTYSKPALEKAAVRGHQQVVEVLIKYGADVNASCGSALQAAAANGHQQVVEVLLRNGADVNACCDSALRVAVANEDEKVVELLLKYGANANASNSIYGSVLVIAASRGHQQLVELLLKHGANVTGSALEVAADNGYEKVVEILLKSGADVNAADNGYEKVVEILLKSGADVNAAQGYALRAAAGRGHQLIVELLLKHGAVVNAGGRFDRTALGNAQWRGHSSIVKILKEHGAI